MVIADRTRSQPPPAHVVLDLVITFTVTPESGGVGCRLRFVVTADATRPVEDALVGRVRYRLNQLINGNLRYSYGQ